MNFQVHNKIPLLIKNGIIVNEEKIEKADVLISDERIVDIGSVIVPKEALVIDASDKFIFPGIIDAQVHFRDPGLTYKADIYTESRAAVAGGVTSFIDMPNTIPNVLTRQCLDEKYKLASKKSLANYGFFMGTTEENLASLLNDNTSALLGISDDGLYIDGKGKLLVDNLELLDELLKHSNTIVAIHSEKGHIIKQNEIKIRERYGDSVPIRLHPEIRSASACLAATRDAIAIAEKYNARLHILHLTTAEETHLFNNKIPLPKKRITTEVCAHHLWFSDEDYKELGTLIKWNPAIKTKTDREELLRALIDDRIDIVTSDHAPHTLGEKLRPYFHSMPGGPMVQHSFNILLELNKLGKISLNKIVQKMSHNPAILYKLNDRGYIRRGYFADLAIVDLKSEWQVTKRNIHSKCGWSPLEGKILHSKVTHTFVNGHLVFQNGRFSEMIAGKALHPMVVQEKTIV